MSWETIKKLQEERGELAGKMRTMVDKAEADNRSLDHGEQLTFDAMAAAVKAKDAERSELESQREADLKLPVNQQAIRNARRALGASDAPHSEYLTRSDSYSEYLQRERGLKRDSKAELRGFGDIVAHAMRTGRKEYRSTTTADTTGLIDSFLFPDWVDLLRAKTRAFQAGVRMLPLEGEYVSYKQPKLTGDVSAAWRAESASISQSTATVTALTYSPKSLSALVRVSRESMSDLPRLNDILAQSFAGAFAVAVDTSIITSTGGDAPVSILSTTSCNSTTVSARMDADVVAAAIERLTQDNVDVSDVAGILGTRDYKNLLTELSTGDGNWKRFPPYFDGSFRPMETSTIAISSAGGTFSAIVGDFKQSTFGMREDLTILVLDERYAEFGDIGIVAHLRGDFQIQQTGAFERLVGITT